MKKILLINFVLFASAWTGLCREEPEELLMNDLQVVFEQHCVECHGKGEKVKGKANLLELDSAKQLLENPELLETLITVVTDGEMPPEDEPPLEKSLRESTIRNLEALLSKALVAQTFAPTPIRRMNRFQYNNAVIDLLELDREIFQLNERLLRRYQDYFDPGAGRMPPVVQVASRPLSKDIDGRRPEGFRGVAPFPQDQRAEHGFDNRADHLTLSPLLMESFLTLSQTIVDSPDLNPQECRSWNWLFAPPGQPVASGSEAESSAHLKLVSSPQGAVRVQDMGNFGPHWSGGKQLLWMCRKKGWEIEFTFLAKSAGDGLRFGFTKASDYGQFEISLDDKVIGQTVDLYSTKVSRAEDLVIPLQIAQGVHRLKFKCVGINRASKSHLFGLDVFEVTGTSGNVKKGDPLPLEQAIRKRIEKLLTRGFRRPVDREELDRFADFAEKSIAEGESFEDTMRAVVGAVLASPDFLYFYETKEGKSESDHRVNDFELASRLALFFWVSIPDDELLEAARAGELGRPETLEIQIDRMLNDPRTSRFCDTFPAQWLQLDRLITSVPDPEKFPYFYYNGYRVSMHMMLEPLLLFETVFLENRSVMDLLDPGFTWQSEMLEANYEGKAQGRADKVLNFKRVPLSDPKRGGVITNAAVMTMTSTPLRTQPITRGAWVNAVIFNDPPEPPPADVPPLPEKNEAELEKLTIRERLAEHREREDCAGCHNKIDPLGFALENYGPTGVWREIYGNGRPVDSSGTLFNRYNFENAIDFKQLLLKEKRRFIRGFCGHLLSYALGREPGPADSPSLDDLTDKALKGEDALRTLMKGIAMSEPFLHKP